MPTTTHTAGTDFLEADGLGTTNLLGCTDNDEAESLKPAILKIDSAWGQETAKPLCPDL
jgi:hypothetical protein